MKFESIRIGYRPGDGWQLQWLLSGIDSDTTIRIERSAGPHGPWDIIDTVSFDTVFYCDYIPEFRSVFKNFWYRLIVVQSGQDVLTSEPQSSESISDYITNEIVRQHNLLLYGVNNHPGFYSRHFACYKPDRYGVKECSGIAPNGEDFLGENMLGDNTKYQNGYLTPIKFKGRWIDTVRKESSTMAIGRRETFNRQLWTSNFPVLDKGDVICEKGTGRNYEILSIDVRMPNNILVSQNVVCKQIDPQFWEAKNLRYPEGFEPWRLNKNAGWWEASDYELSASETIITGKKGVEITGDVAIVDDSFSKRSIEFDGSSKLTFDGDISRFENLEFCIFGSFSDLDKLQTSVLFSIANSASSNNYIGIQAFPTTPGDSTTNVIRIIGRDSAATLFLSSNVVNPDNETYFAVNFKGSEVDIWLDENKVIDAEAHGWGSFNFDLFTFGNLTRTSDAFFTTANFRKLGVFNRTVSDHEIAKTIRYLKGENL